MTSHWLLHWIPCHTIWYEGYDAMPGCEQTGSCHWLTKTRTKTTAKKYCRRHALDYIVIVNDKVYVILAFLPRVSTTMMTRDLDIAILSVCPSVCHVSVLYWNTHIRLLNKKLTDRNHNNEIVNIVVTAQSLINVTVKISVNKISIKETCSTFWKQSIIIIIIIMFAWSEVVVFCSCGDWRE